MNDYTLWKGDCNYGLYTKYNEQKDCIDIIVYGAGNTTVNLKEKGR